MKMHTSFELDKVIALSGIKNAFNDRFSSKMLYSVPFFIEYAQYVSSFIMGMNGKSKSFNF